MTERHTPLVARLAPLQFPGALWHLSRSTPAQRWAARVAVSVGARWALAGGWTLIHGSACADLQRELLLLPRRSR